MNTFNMKQWLTENRVGPYIKTSLNEDHGEWLDKFHNAVQALKADQWMKKQLMDIPSQDVVSMYGETDPERAAQEILSKMFHSANEGISEARGRHGEVKVPEWEIQILGKYHMIDADVDYEYDVDQPDYVDDRMVDPGGAYITGATAKITKLEVEDGDEYREVNDPAYIKQIEDLLNTDPKLNRELEKQAQFWAEDDLGEDDGYVDNYDGYQNEQMGVGYVMKTKPSTDHDY